MRLTAARVDGKAKVKVVPLRRKMERLLIGVHSATSHAQHGTPQHRILRWRHARHHSTCCGRARPGCRAHRDQHATSNAGFRPQLLWRSLTQALEQHAHDLERNGRPSEIPRRWGRTCEGCVALLAVGAAHAACRGMPLFDWPAVTSNRDRSELEPSVRFLR